MINSSVKKSHPDIYIQYIYNIRDETRSSGGEIAENGSRPLMKVYMFIYIIYIYILGTWY